MSGLICDSYKSDSDSEDEKLNIEKPIVDTNPKKRVAVFKVHIKKEIEDIEDDNHPTDEVNTSHESKDLSDLLPAPKKAKKSFVAQPPLPSVNNNFDVYKPSKIEIAPKIDGDYVSSDVSDDDEPNDDGFVGPAIPSHLKKRNIEEKKVIADNYTSYTPDYPQQTSHNFQTLNYLPEQYRPKGHELKYAMSDQNWTTINAQDLQNSKLYLTDDDILEHEKAKRKAMSGFTRVTKQKSQITYLSAIAKTMEDDIMKQKDIGRQKRAETRRKYGM